MMMMMNWCSRRVWMASVVMLCLSASTAWAFRTSAVTTLPGVNGAGARSAALGNLALLKLNVNTRQRTLTASGGTTVTNLRGTKATFFNPALITITSDLYVVQANGNATYRGAGNY